MGPKILIKRGLETNRTGVTPDAGEFLWTTDNKDLWIGDGSTAGGIKVTANVENTSTLTNYYNKTESDGRFGKFINDATLTTSTDTASFISELSTKYSCFSDKQITLKIIWDYSANSDLDTGHPTIGTIELAGCLIETWGGTYKHVRISRPTTGAGGVGVYEYNDQGSIYSPGWREIWTSESDGSGSGLDADTLDGYNHSAFVPSVATYNTTSAASTRYKIKLPFKTDSGKMIKFTISAYQSYKQHTYEVSGYLYSSIDQWYAPTVIYNGIGEPDIKLGRDTDGYAYASIGPGDYTGIRVHSLVLSNLGTVEDSYNQGWTITATDDAPDTVSVSINKMWHSGNDGPGSGLDADLLDGNEGTYFDQSQFTGSSFTSRDIGNPLSVDSSTINSVGYTTDSSAAGYADGGLFVAAYSTDWVSQIFSNFRDGHISVRGKNNGTWQPWYKVWDSGNDGPGSGLDADLLDGLDSTAFSRVDGHSIHSDASNDLSVGWYTVAVNSGNRAIARFGLRDTKGGRHQSTIFYASHHYGSHSEITVLHSGRYGGTPFRYIRVKEGGTYDGALLQVYIDDSTNTLSFFMLGDNFQSTGWVIKDFVPDGTDPGGVGDFSALNNVAAQVDLDQTMDGGISTTGSMYIGGKTVQHKVLHSDAVIDGGSY